MVYIGSDVPLPLIDWSDDKPAFNISELSKYEKDVKTQLKLPHVYQVGSHQGCGCGFFKKPRDYQELMQVEENYFHLASYLEQAKFKEARVQIYACWEEDHEAEPESSKSLELTQLTEKAFEIKEYTLYTIL